MILLFLNLLGEVGRKAAIGILPVLFLAGVLVVVLFLDGHARQPLRGMWKVLFISVLIGILGGLVWKFM